MTGNFLQLGLVRPVFGVLLPIGLVLLLLAFGRVLSLSGRSRKVRWAAGVLGLILAIVGLWALVVKPSLEITGLRPLPLHTVLRSGEPCPKSIEVAAVVRAKGGPERVSLQLSAFEGGQTVAVAPEFVQSFEESRQVFGPYKLELPANPPRTGAVVILRATMPNEKSSTAVIRNDGCVPRR